MTKQAWIWEPTAQWVRVLVNGEKSTDSKRVMLMLEENHQLTDHFPLEDVRQEVLLEEICSYNL